MSYLVAPSLSSIDTAAATQQAFGEGAEQQEQQAAGVHTCLAEGAASGARGRWRKRRPGAGMIQIERIGSRSVLLEKQSGVPDTYFVFNK